MIEQYRVKETETEIILEVTLKLQDQDKKECFTLDEARYLLEKDGYKAGKILNYTLLSNVSERKRKGEFIFSTIKEPLKEEVLEEPVLFQPKVSKRKSKKEE